MIPLSMTKDASRDKLLNMLAREAYRYGNFSLASGRTSQHYVNCKPVTLSGLGLQLLSMSLLEYVEENALAVAGLTLGADPIVSGVAMQAAQMDRQLDALIVRKEAKGHGTGSWLEGPIPPEGSLVTVLEDVVTTGGSSLKAVNKIREAGFLVKRVITIVDRQEGGDIAINNAGLDLVSLFLLKDVVAKATTF